MIFGQNSLLKSLFSQSVFVLLYISKQREKIFLCVSVYMWFFFKSPHVTNFFHKSQAFFFRWMTWQVLIVTGQAKLIRLLFIFLKSFFFRENPRKISEKQQQPNQPAQNWNQAEFWVEKQILISDKNRSDQLLLVK